MEMKYLSEQNSGNICLPLCHVKGIVGLDVNSSNSISNQDIALSGQYFITGSKARVVYFDNITFVSVDIQLTGSGITYLQAGNTIKVTSSGFNNTENVVLDCIIKDADTIARGCMGYVWIEDGSIYIKTICKQISFTTDPDDPTSIIETEVVKPFTKIIGNAISTTKTFAPIRPIVPKGYITFSIPQRITTFTLGPIEVVGELELEIDTGSVEFTKNGSFYYVTVANTTKDYKLTVKGKFNSFVYPKGTTITAIEIHDCTSLNWFSVNAPAANVYMVQNTSLVSFGLYGKHKMTNLSYFLANLPLLTTVSNLSTNGVTSLRGCFSADAKLAKLPEMDFDMVNNVRDLCFGCTSLTYVPSTINWSKVVDAGRAFYQCTGLLSLPVLNTESLMYAEYMYFSCNKLSIINMDASKLNLTNNMFVECTSLTRLIMTSLIYSINIQDTNLKSKTAVTEFIQNVGTASISEPAIVHLPQAVPLYGFDNNFIQYATNKNWRLG